MKSASAMLVFAVAACSAERQPASDTTALDSAAAPAAAADSQGLSARDAQSPASTKAPARSGAIGKSATKGSSKTTIDADTGMHPTDTFGIHPRDSTIADFLKKRPPEVRRPQDPQKTPR